MSQAEQNTPGDAGVEPIIQRLEGAAGTPASSPMSFWDAMLAAKCRLAGAAGAAFIRCDHERNVGVVSAYPHPQEGSEPPAWLRQCAETIRRDHPITARTLVELPQLEAEPRHHIMIVPNPFAGTTHGYEVFLLEERNGVSVEEARERLELVDSFAAFLAKGPGATQLTGNLLRLKSAMQVLAVVNNQDKFAGAAMAFCNEVAAQWRCERVSLGVADGAYVKLKAMSHTENFVRKMQLVQAIESTMEECIDQDIEVAYPTSEDWPYVNRAAAALSRRHGPTGVLSLPLRKGGRSYAVVTLERPMDKPIPHDEIETLRLTCELCAARLIDMYLGSRRLLLALKEEWRTFRQSLAEPRRSGVKTGAALAIIGLFIITVGRGTYKAEAPFIIEAVSQQVVAAPFDGFIKEVNVEAGDSVEAGQTVLAELDTAELRLLMAQAEAEKVAYEKQAAAATRDDKTAQAQIAQASADRAQAQTELLQYKIEQARLTSATSGTVIQGDLKRAVGAPVHTGDILFEVTPIGAMRAELRVPEDRIFDIKVGQEGYLATFSYPSQRIQFEVESITPVAEVINQRNVFKVRAILKETPSWLRPGMEGIAKVHAGRRSLLWIWTHKVTDWLRMKLWI